ncbi:MAG: hypothetical protein K6F33_14410, partial [Bacteroidales bacterium]|nr:hypothetical protein [Bacteroidales bacterium]
FIGRTKKANTSKTLQISSDKTGIFGTSTTEVQQGDGKAVVQLSGGKLNLAGSQTQLYGKTTVNAAAEVKGQLTTPAIKADNVEAGKSFKSTNISDGIPMPAAGASGSLSASLKEADAPAES